MSAIPPGLQSGCRLIPYERWMPQLPQLQKSFRDNVPFPHILLQDFLDEPIACEIEAAFPASKKEDWIHYRHYNENTLGKNDVEELPEILRAFMAELVSPRFAAFVSQLTGIADLVGDPVLEGAGLHLTERGGFLRVHTDFTHHHRRPELRRRCNMILYFNKDWQDAWGGALELWDKTVTSCVRRYPPHFNHALFFETTSDSFHGYPQPISPPAHIGRKSITSYYYSVEVSRDHQHHSTKYVTRPGDDASPLLVKVDNLLISVYSRLKRGLGVSDRLTGRLLDRLMGRGKR